MSVVLFLFLALSFPVVAYSIDAYSSFPVSEKAGMEFIAKNIPLRDKVLASAFQQQMPLFQTDMKSAFRLSSLTSLEQGDVFVLRSTGYYYSAMRYELSFTDNTHTRYLVLLHTSPQIMSIYFNPTTSVFIKSPR